MAKSSEDLFLTKCLDFFLIITWFQQTSPVSNLVIPVSININQSITHEINKSFDDELEVRSVFLDISKAFDKVWHEGVIFKLKQNGISGDLLNI